ncbi:pyridoxal phosphate-dependent aminotransferase [Virgibacillus sp. MSJ-26]|uniref:MalY/PatB family protein n=1 Tax=Virgibacillus sp. MSJ-26 TaxID=2841522 RepID=UPI001C0FFD06|nr:MalY/PatB family protein [Virgibacillus sp. MSJ-26]MBU5467219.1 pyridoxal phosphate-dependent aminotransferase [Virgibacillus sp. MSJ-26]
MSYFETVPNRKNTRSVKWDTLEEVFQSGDVLPMWVADMDFKAPEAVNNALIERAKHGVYGYTIINPEVKGSIVNWLHRRFNWKVEEEWLSFSPGVVTSLHIAVQAFTEPEDKVLIQTPVYPPFYNVIEAHNRQIVKSPLILKDDHYSIDFTDFENKLKQGVKAFILCSPHNPVGRVWTKEELQKMAELCVENDVILISDEIHADLVLGDYKHTPIATLSEDIAMQTVTCMAPSKTFNLAGLQASYIVTKHPEKRLKIDQLLKKQGLGSLNTMGSTALHAAYEHGEEWLKELLKLLNSHQEYVVEMFKTHTPELKVIPAQGTYLLWIDCSRLGMTDEELHQFMVSEARVGLNAGSSYGEEGKQFMRMNIATSRQTLEKGVKQIVKAVKHLNIQ